MHVARVDFQQNRAAVAAADFQGGGAAGGEMDVVAAAGNQAALADGVEKRLAVPW